MENFSWILSLYFFYPQKYFTRHKCTEEIHNNYVIQQHKMKWWNGVEPESAARRQKFTQPGFRNYLYLCLHRRLGMG